MSTSDARDAAGDGALVADVAVVGAGPAGLSAALNLVRARRTVLLVDANRPRNAATLRSHGFLTRDGVSPLELRRLGREEVDGYDEATVVQAVVDRLTPIPTTTASASTTASAPTTPSTSDPDASRWSLHGTWRGSEVTARVRSVVIATGLREEFPQLPMLRAFYGTAVHSCVECDGYERSGEPLAFIAETPDVVDRALLIAALTDDLVVFTNGVAPVDRAGRARLAEAGVRLEERPIADLEGGREGMTGVRLADGHVVPRTGGFVRPGWHADLDWVDAALDRDEDGLVRVDRVGRTGVEGLYAVGDVTPPGPEQLIVAAGHGAMTAAAVHRDLVGGLRDLRDAVQ